MQIILGLAGGISIAIALAWLVIWGDRRRMLREKRERLALRTPEKKNEHKARARKFGLELKKLLAKFGIEYWPRSVYRKGFFPTVGGHSAFLPTSGAYLEVTPDYSTEMLIVKLHNLDVDGLRGASLQAHTLLHQMILGQLEWRTHLDLDQLDEEGDIEMVAANVVDGLIRYEELARKTGELLELLTDCFQSEIDIANQKTRLLELIIDRLEASTVAHFLQIQ